MNYHDTESYNSDSGYKPLNDQNTENYKAMMMGQPGIIDPTMPPPEYHKAFIRYTLNNDMIPNYYNGVKGDSGKISIDVENIPQNKIRIAAVVCRPGYADSEIVVRYYNKGFGKKPEKEYIERGKDENNNINISKSELAKIFVLNSDRKGGMQISASDSSVVMPPPSSDSS